MEWKGPKMDCSANPLKIRKKKYFLWLSVIATGVLFLSIKLASDTSGAVPLNGRIPVQEEFVPAVEQEQTEDSDLELPSEAIVPQDSDQELVELLRQSLTDNSDVFQPDAPKWKVVRMRVTGYCTCPKCCGKFSDGRTADMHRIRRGDVFVAADKKVPFGTQMIIPGYNNNNAVEVKDRGRLIYGNRLDLFFSDHKAAKKWGVKYLDVLVYVGE